jgi:hypothetical protein
MTAIRRALPWVLWAFAIGMGAAGGVLMLRNLPHDPGLFVPHVFLVPGYATVGAVVASRRRTHPAGWLFLAVALLAAANTLAFSYAAAVYVTKLATYPGAAYGAWASNVLFPLSFVFFGAGLLVFPNGSLPSRRWRSLPVVLGVTWGLFVLTAAFGPEIEMGTSTKVANPFGIAVLRPVAGLVFLLTIPAFGTLLACAAAPFFRRRKASRVEREQLRWLAYACGFSAVATIAAAVAALFKTETFVTIFSVIVLAGIAAGIPAAVGVAILRYRLFEIDRIISRTLAYAVVTALLGGTFSLVVLVPTTVLGSGGTKTPGWLVAMATLVVFGLFRPLLRRVRSVIDRRFNRSRYDAARTIEAFSARLRDEIDLATLRAELEDVTRTTMEPSHVSLWVREDKQ